MFQIKPITDLRKTNEISELCHKSDEPICITKNGHGDLVIMSIERYNRDAALLNIYKKLLDAENQVNEGQLVDAGEVFAELKKKHS